MSEEVTYADLKFQDSSQTENIQKFDKFEKEDPPVPSHVWRQGALALTLLCLLLLIGLGVFGAICMEKLNKLQNFKEELQRNLSLQLMQNTNSSQKIRNLSIKLEEIATKLCRELYTKNKEHKCKPCPEEWMWHDDKCYLLHAYQRQETWQKSDEICSGYNASLLTIKSKSVLEFIKSLMLSNFWLGLSPRKDNPRYRNLDTVILLHWFTRNTSVINDKMYCGWIHYTTVYYTKCTETKSIICEKLAQSVKIESILMSEVLDGRK
ncbi:C-type lectin domain family 12 member A isoform X2 [Bos indicus x Bos taurus]|uniref:C-type lectin domain family 12 member A n=1 Tax=Bos indicus x Bos taurus TaxID=30522 RepID=A0A4W2CA02_BOBOX|nr:C-type lectin domain family 12 member A isoform X2 [Bos indicus x Bos taurus]